MLTLDHFSRQLREYLHTIQHQMQPEVVCYYFEDDGRFPNNADLPVIVYKAFPPGQRDVATIEKLFKRNHWENAWRNGVYSYHHYHSTAHEVLAIYAGSISLQLGGQEGHVVALQKGDVVVIPAGVAHKNVACSTDFKCLGAYPKGQDYDMNYGLREERPAADENIAKVPLPAADPLCGNDGPLVSYWGIQVKGD